MRNRVLSTQSSSLACTITLFSFCKMETSRRNVYLGFSNALEPDKLFSLKRQFLPLGKVGGLPAWLNPANIPQIEQLACTICKKPLAFLLQVYCTCPSSPSHAFHRSIFIFICKDPECSRTNDSSNFVVFRCQLPRQNAFYSAESALDPWIVGDVPDPFYNASTFAKLCRICGCRAVKKCGKCTQQWYCSREHQVIDWTVGDHKQLCGTISPEKSNNNSSSVEIDCANGLEVKDGSSFVFKEFGIEIDAELADDDAMEYNHDSDEEDNDTVQMDEKELSTRLKELKKFEVSLNSSTLLRYLKNDQKIKFEKIPAIQFCVENKNRNLFQNPNCKISDKDLEGIEEETKDLLYVNFHRVLSTNPTQILRYEKGGQPLLATDYSPQPIYDKKALETGGFEAERRKIPVCELCGAKRQYELQLMPNLLSLIDVDQPGKSIDWATLMVFTCSRDCMIPNDGYAREFSFKQDFVDFEKNEDNGCK